MQRIVQPEILDSLPPDDPAALANRRDLKLYNHLMGNFRWIRQVLSQRPLPGRLMELGSGDGALGLYLKTHKILTDDSSLTGVDLAPRPEAWPETWHWTQEDLLTINYTECGRTLLANMILHQFETPQLHDLGRRFTNSGIRRLIVCEPCRRPLHLRQVTLSRLLGVHSVSLHDARVSIQGGFRRDEIVDELALDRNDWKVSWSEHFFGANRVICERL